MDTNRPNENCPQCGAPIAPQSPSGLCPRCLMGEAMQPTTAAPGKAAPAVPLLEEVAAAFPDYEVSTMIGRGGMGAVFRARQKSLDRDVALKILPPDLAASDASFAQRFEAEAKALATMTHPNIVTVHDFGRAGEFYFLSMEYVEGINLRQLLGAGRLSPEEAIGIVPPLCDALQYAHDRNVIHCDIKPENILLAKDGRVKVADFGIAQIVGADTEASGSAPVAGTPAYMAPEQLRSAGGKIDRRADIYALGKVLYEMLTGERPGPELQPPSQKVSVDVRIDEIVLRALREEPELRFQTAAEMRTQLDTLPSRAATPRPEQPAASMPPPTNPEQKSPRSAKSAKWSMMLTASSLVSFFMVMFGLLSLWQVEVTESSSGGSLAEREMLAEEMNRANSAYKAARSQGLPNKELALLRDAMVRTQQDFTTYVNSHDTMETNRGNPTGMIIALLIVAFTIGSALWGCTMGWNHLGRERHYPAPHAGLGSAGFAALCWPVLILAGLASFLVAMLIDGKRTVNIEIVLAIVAALIVICWAIRGTVLWFCRRPSMLSNLIFAGLAVGVLVLAAITPALFS